MRKKSKSPDPRQLCLIDWIEEQIPDWGRLPDAPCRRYVRIIVRINLKPRY